MQKSITEEKAFFANEKNFFFSADNTFKPLETVAIKIDGHKPFMGTIGKQTMNGIYVVHVGTDEFVVNTNRIGKLINDADFSFQADNTFNKDEKVAVRNTEGTLVMGTIIGKQPFATDRYIVAIDTQKIPYSISSIGKLKANLGLWKKIKHKISKSEDSQKSLNQPPQRNGLRHNAKAIMTDIAAYAQELLVSISSTKKRSTETWKMPTDDRRLNEVCFIGSHEAYTAPAYGFILNEQTKTITEQLKAGSRFFDFRVFKASEKIPTKTDDIILCHAGDRKDCTEKQHKFIMKPGSPFPRFVPLLKEISSFLKKPKNKNEIVIILIGEGSRKERIGESDIAESIFEKILVESNIYDLVLFPSKYTPHERWPSVSTLQRSDKRVIFLEEHGRGTPSQYTYDRNKFYTSFPWHTREVTPATLVGIHIGHDTRRDFKPLKEDRPGSYDTPYAASYFLRGAVYDSQADERNSTMVARYIEHIASHGIDYRDKIIWKGRFPNIIEADNIDRGNLVLIVNSINTFANDKEIRNYIFGDDETRARIQARIKEEHK